MGEEKRVQLESFLHYISWAKYSAKPTHSSIKKNVKNSAKPTHSSMHARTPTHTSAHARAHTHTHIHTHTHYMKATPALHISRLK